MVKLKISEINPESQEIMHFYPIYFMADSNFLTELLCFDFMNSSSCYFAYLISDILKVFSILESNWFYTGGIPK